MDVREEMEKDLITLLSKSVLEKEDDVPYRLSAQAAALNEIQCTNPDLGRWIDACDFPFLIETLMLDPEVFSGEFPGVNLTVDERKSLADALELHCESCPRCHLKRAYDLEWQSRIKRAIAENKQAIGKALSKPGGKNSGNLKKIQGEDLLARQFLSAGRDVQGARLPIDQADQQRETTVED